eukprot:gene5282-15459_t
MTAMQTQSSGDQAEYDPSARATHEKGSFLQNYELLEKIGRGHYASVYKCTLLATGETRAVKVMDFTKASVKRLQNVIEEVRILSALQAKNKADGKNIIKLY